MSKGVTVKLDKTTRRARMEKLVSFLTSGQPWGLFTEEFESDLTFGQTESEWASADSAIDRDNPGTRLAANFAGALFRDAKYAHAGRNYLLKQGHHNAFRELYEGGKISIDNEKEWEEES